MASIKQTNQVLGNLMGQINGVLPQQPAGQFPSNFGGGSPGGFTAPMGGAGVSDDSIPTGMFDAAPVFEINYKSTEKQCVKNAKDSLKKLVKEVVPTVLQNSTVLQDKIEQDAYTLGHMYYEYIKMQKVAESCMETIRRGETQARLFEVYSKLADQAMKFGEKVMQTQNQIRKNYIDTYMDLQQKEEVDNGLTQLAGNNVKAIEAPEEETTPENQLGTNTFMGTENTIKSINDRKRLAMMKKAQDAKFEEVKE